MRLLLLIFFACICTGVSAQSFRLLIEERKFADVIKQFGDKEASLDPEETYLLGYSYFQTGDDEKAIVFFDKALAKNFREPRVHFMKGLSFRYLDKFPEALAAFDSAYANDMQNQEYLCEKAFTLYLTKKYAEAIAIYEEAKKLPNTYQAPWYMIPHIWFIQGKDAEALQGLYDGLTHIAKDNSYYATTLMEIAKIENRLNKNYTKAKDAYLKILAEDAVDYTALEGLMVVYNKTSRRSSADSIFAVLKKAFDEEKLKGNMMKYKRAKVAEYEYDGKEIFVYKNFTPPAKMIDIMYRGYLMDKAGENIERIFQTEQTIQMNDKSPKHILCETWVNGKGRSNYGVGWISDNITTDDFFELIKEVLAGKIKAAASSSFK